MVAPSKLKVVLTAAIMDVFHEGHKNIIDRMNERGTWVVVVLHDDRSCYRIKGKIPIQTTRHRKRNVLLAGADEVRITLNTDPADQFERVIEEYGRDNILFMRGDDNTNFPGKWLIEKYGIPIEYIPYTQSTSSTEIRNSIKGEE